MEADFWLDRWRRNQIGFHQKDFNRHLVKHWRTLGVRPGARVFVPLCGKSRDLIWLSGQGYSVVGCEISRIAVESFFKEASLEPQQTADGPFQRWSAGSIEILLGDFFSLSRNCVGWFDAVYDRASLVALSETMRPRYARKMAELVPAGTSMLLITVEYPQQERHGPPFSAPSLRCAICLAGCRTSSCWSPRLIQVRSIGDWAGLPKGRTGCGWSAGSSLGGLRFAVAFSLRVVRGLRFRVFHPVVSGFTAGRLF